MKIVSLEISNILSIEKANITFGDKGLILVEGFDYDTGRANGAGKSSIFNALSYALFDKVPRGITKSDILRNGSKTGYATASVRTDAGIIAVRRSRPSSTTFYKDNIEIDMTQAEFEKLIGMNYEQFLITMYTAQDTNNKFIYLNDTGKKNFILKIMSLDNFSKYRQNVSDSIKALEIEKSNLTGKMEAFKSSVEINKSNIVDKTSIEAEIESINNDIDFYSNKIKEQQAVQKPDLSKYDELETKLNQQLTTINTTKTLREMDLKEFNRYSLMIKPFNPKDPDAACPVCSADLNIQGNTLAKADDMEALKKQHESHMQELEAIKAEYKTKIDKHDEILIGEQSLIDTLNKLKSKKIEESKEYSDAQVSMAEYYNTVKFKHSQLIALNNKLNDNEELKGKLANIIKEATDCKSRIDAINSEQLVLEAVESIFDSTGAPAYIMDSIVDAFNDAVSEYISEIWPNASYSLQTYKTNKDKTVKAKFSESLIINGKDRSIGSLSGGEIRALSLALDFAIIDVLGSKYSLSLNPIILDEPFNGLDSLGREMVIDILKKFSENRQVWVVDHASEAKTMFDDVIRVEKRNGVSNIV